MPRILNNETIRTQLRDWRQIAQQKALASFGSTEGAIFLSESKRYALCLEHIEDLLEEIRVVRANHAQLLKDFDARNELLEKERQSHLLTKGTLMVRTEQLAAERRIYKAARPGTAMPRPEQRCEPSNEFWFGESGPETNARVERHAPQTDCGSEKDSVSVSARTTC